MSSSKRVSSITVTEVGTVWLDGFIELHVLRGSDSFGRLALVQLAGELRVVFAQIPPGALLQAGQVRGGQNYRNLSEHEAL